MSLPQNVFNRNCSGNLEVRSHLRDVKKAVSILIHKKGDSDKPENFRPITLEPVLLKVFTSLLRDRIYGFLQENNYIQCQIQKCFIQRLSGTLEHTYNLSYLIDQTRIKQRSLIVTLLDLKNAFGEVDHMLIKTTLGYHHIPDFASDIILNIYNDFYTTILTKSYVTDYIRVEKGVLQGDSLSPLLFNMVINTFIQPIKKEEYTQLGYSFHKAFYPRHWFQFADDVAVIT